MDEQIFEHLRDALNNLYDAEHMRVCPLSKELGLAGRPDTPIAMQKALEGLIQALKPKHDDPRRSHKRRMFDLLYSRYIDQFSQREVANQLGISLRSYQREQKLALEFLASLLVEKYPHMKASSTVLNQNKVHEEDLPEELDEEFSWMFAPSAQRNSELEEVLVSACQLAQPLAIQYNVAVRLDLSPALPRVAVHPQALLQIVLNVLLPAIHKTANGEVVLKASFLRQISLDCSGRLVPRELKGGLALVKPVDDLSSVDQSSLEIARRLSEKAGGSFWARVDTSNFTVRVYLPSLESVPVLVIDDNADNIKLVQRYLAGTSYKVSSLNQPELALEFVEQNRPQVVVLDLMMPGVDGLEILTHLHSNPLTINIPVIVCTILPQEELAISLGASLFLRKPVSQEKLLASLDHLCFDQAKDSE